MSSAGECDGTPESELIPDGNRMTRLRRNLSRWYAANGRELPWRATHDPYRIWISEIMLQQTTVAAVIPYFDRFLKQFPTVDVLAAADENDVLRMWEGLGYYSRARNIHTTARQLVAERDGTFPEDADELQRLPGIGRYTAGAIASFAFDRRAPIVEANTLRLYSRLLGYQGDPRSSAGQKLLWRFAEEVLPRKQPGRFNQALMELGSTVCTPTAPDCPKCPLRTVCRAFAENLQSEIPRPKPRPQITPVVEASIAIRRADTYLLRQRRPEERWAGLWDFPRFEVGPDLLSQADESPERMVPFLQQSLRQPLEKLTGVSAELTSVVTELRHSVTRYRIRLICLEAEYRDGRLANGEETQQWCRPEEFEGLAFSVTGRKLARLLSQRDIGSS
ncbi:A/G-specific adenine glycosylase [Maioricimonas rarisocia]|uniref:Adenine DNA glycosylase n=1 Tax=Maioricimonas rarisocia TaxID=2528026 RepID=A0A517Z1Y4_9PLAN|nr:A/G-specific adenine glycosylase [Maioricimonas rarisocia]QDU36490.1 A/G-specific adenine glycosylase [Maioricimonas rarisocia]